MVRSIPVLLSFSWVLFGSFFSLAFCRSCILPLAFAPFCLFGLFTLSLGSAGRGQGVLSLPRTGCSAQTELMRNCTVYHLCYIFILYVLAAVLIYFYYFIKCFFSQCMSFFFFFWFSLLPGSGKEGASNYYDFDCWLVINHDSARHIVMDCQTSPSYKVRRRKGSQIVGLESSSYWLNNYI